MNPLIKKTIAAILPTRLFNYLKIKKSRTSIFINLLKGYKYDLALYYKFSDTNGSDTALKLVGKIIREYHVIEKGLTMCDTRLGFGKAIVLSLCESCELFIVQYGKDDEQLVHAIGVLLEYKKMHDSHNFQLDYSIVSSIQKLESYSTLATVTTQKELTKLEYFNKVESNFPEFSSTRSSIRNFTNEEISLEKILNILELARNTPSACNRQSWRTYVYAEKEQICKILDIQGGNRGFGHLSNKLIIVTAELGVFGGQGERNQVYIDGGMYAMNLLYSLHYNQLAACILNCSNFIEKDKQLRKICRIKDSEVFIAMIACGIPPESFKIAISKRYSLDKTNVIV